jgi:hypothetical protein
MKGLALKSLQGALLEWPEGVRGLLEGGCEEIGSELIDTQQVWVTRLMIGAVDLTWRCLHRCAICSAALRGRKRLQLASLLLQCLIRLKPVA